MIHPVIVIAIVGTSGAGKSTLVGELVKRLDDANSLSFDDYIETSTYPSAVQWLADGADPNQFQTPEFVTDVQKLINGTSIIHPETKQKIKPARFLVLDEHFGREREIMRELIDMVILIDIPLEIAHARKMLRKGKFFPWEDNPELFIKDLRDHLNWYMRIGRDFYIAVDKRVRRNCDLIVNGLLPTETIADEVYQFVMNRLENESKQ